MEDQRVQEEEFEFEAPALVKSFIKDYEKCVIKYIPRKIAATTAKEKTWTYNKRRNNTQISIGYYNIVVTSKAEGEKSFDFAMKFDFDPPSQPKRAEARGEVEEEKVFCMQTFLQESNLPKFPKVRIRELREIRRRSVSAMKRQLEREKEYEAAKICLPDIVTKLDAIVLILDETSDAICDIIQDIRFYNMEGQSRQRDMRRQYKKKSKAIRKSRREAHSQLKDLYLEYEVKKTKVGWIEQMFDEATSRCEMSVPSVEDATKDITGKCTF